MKMQEFKELSTFEKLKFLRKCDGVHSSLDDLFNCEPCSFLFEDLPTETQENLRVLRSEAS